MQRVETHLDIILSSGNAILIIIDRVIAQVNALKESIAINSKDRNALIDQATQLVDLHNNKGVSGLIPDFRNTLHILEDLCELSSPAYIEEQQSQDKLLAALKKRVEELNLAADHLNARIKLFKSIQGFKTRLYNAIEALAILTDSSAATHQKIWKLYKQLKTTTTNTEKYAKKAEIYLGESGKYTNKVTLLIRQFEAQAEIFLHLKSNNESYTRKELEMIDTYLRIISRDCEDLQSSVKYIKDFVDRLTKKDMPQLYANQQSVPLLFNKSSHNSNNSLTPPQSTNTSFMSI